VYLPDELAPLVNKRSKELGYSSGNEFIVQTLARELGWEPTASTQERLPLAEAS
jgi:hypothetical protein